MNDYYSYMTRDGVVRTGEVDNQVKDVELNEGLPAKDSLMLKSVRVQKGAKGIRE